MNNHKSIYVGISLAIMLSSLTSCSGGDNAVASQPATVVIVQEAEPTEQVCNSCGVVSGISTVTVDGKGTGVGAVLGALVGGLAGNQVGGGDGKKVATVAGVIGGAVVGEKIEGDRNDTTYYEILITMEDDSQRVITVPDKAGLLPGSKW